MSVLNPFWHGTPVRPEEFIGREHELNQIIGRILTGQSTAITGSPRCGKTSVLDYLRSPTMQQKLYEKDAEQLIFSYLDAYNWGTESGPFQFWETALRPLATESTLSQAYQDCKDNQFGEYALEKLITQIKEITNKRLVLMVDGFNAVLDYPPPQHWNAAFFGSVRTLISRSGGRLALIITLNGPLSDFQKAVQESTRSKSPYFNFIYEVRLGAFTNEVVKQLLTPGGKRFTESDSQLIQEMAGGHPYLLQVAASMRWEMGERFKSPPEFIEKFYYQVKDVLDEIWQSWSGSLQEAFISVALVQMDRFKEVLKKRLQIDTKQLRRRLPASKLDLEYLRQYGFLIKDEEVASDYKVMPQIFLPFALLNFKPEYRNKLPKEVFNYLFVPGYDERSKFPFFKFG
jgi:hypothetical protein